MNYKGSVVLLCREPREPKTGCEEGYGRPSAEYYVLLYKVVIDMNWDHVTGYRLDVTRSQCKSGKGNTIAYIRRIGVYSIWGLNLAERALLVAPLLMLSPSYT